MSKHSATTYKVSFIDRFKMALTLHKKNALSSLSAIFHNPGNSLMTILVLAIALTLPSLFFVFTSNAQAVSNNWSGGVQLTLFLQQSATDNQKNEFLQQLNLRPEFDDVSLITSEQALEEFKSASGFGEALEYLSDNPLPNMIVLTPSVSDDTLQQLQTLANEFQALPIVDIAQLDMEWVQKYHAILDIGKKIATFISLLLALGVILIVGNTIRLAILNRREEIQIIKLVGATDAFIRRPFLYSGFWYGLIAAVLAAFMVNIIIYLLKGSANQLAELYNSGFSLLGLEPIYTLHLLLIGSFLGLLGAWVSVNKHLRDIQPH